MTVRRAVAMAASCAAIASGCEQVLDVDAYSERASTTSSSGGGGTGGSGGTTTSTTSASSTGSSMPDACFKGQDAVYLGGDTEIAGHQDRCTTAQLDALGDCWFNGDLDCASFFNDGANADCSACVRGTTSEPTVPALMTAFGVQYFYVQVLACEAVAEAKEHCIEAVALEFCRVSACEGCYDDDSDYDSCADYAYREGCSAITLSPDCESIFTTYSPDCWSQDLAERLMMTATMLCGPPQ
ncbi:MAG: hypothetical protein HOV80_09435 [Polyangiaceae bacterium]|nr:hypothetical protein [Polyangiaceae bacterium]